MKTRTSSKSRLVARSRGQVLVLACVALLVTALMLMASFNLTNAVHERIRIQSHADAVAYSLATVEARSFNATAHFNRAIAAALVAQMSLHSWMAIATNDVGMLNAGMLAMLAIAGIEAAMGCYPYNISHCPCVFAALRSALKFMRSGRKWANKVKNLESKFNDGVTDLRKMVESLHKRQKAILNAAKGELSGMGTVVSSLTSTNARRATVASAFASLNQSEFNCAQEGGSDGNAGCSGRTKASADTRSIIIENTANATRPFFDRMGTTAINHQNFLSPVRTQEPQDQLSDGTFMQAFVTRAKVGKKGSGSGSNKQDKAEEVGAGNLGVGIATILGFKHVPIMAMPFGGSVYSNSSGGSHRAIPFGNVHSGRHGEFKGVQMQDPCNGDESCFVNFRSLNDADKDYGMPSVYAGVSQNLRLYQTKSGDFKDKAPWEVNDNGEVSIELSRGQPAKLKLVPRGEGYAVAKAKVYFHQQGNWKIAPNFFDPFWRAKLHFFSKSEMQKAVGLVGDGKGNTYVSMGAPVEGEE